MAMRIGIYIYDEAEVLDFSGPFEVFSTACRLVDKKPFEVLLIAQNMQTVKARGGYKVLPDCAIANAPPLDVLIVVGGDHSREIHKLPVIEWITQQSKQCSLMASVCTGAFLLAEANVITDHKVTTHWEDIEDLRSLFPSLDVIENVRWVDQGSVVTSAGISAGIDMSLHLVARLHSAELAENTANKMAFLWLKNHAS